MDLDWFLIAMLISQVPHPYPINLFTLWYDNEGWAYSHQKPSMWPWVSFAHWLWLAARLFLGTVFQREVPEEAPLGTIHNWRRLWGGGRGYPKKAIWVDFKYIKWIEKEGPWESPKIRKISRCWLRMVPYVLNSRLKLACWVCGTRLIWPLFNSCQTSLPIIT